MLHEAEKGVPETHLYFATKAPRHEGFPLLRFYDEINNDLAVQKGDSI